MDTDEKLQELDTYYEGFKRRIFAAGYEPESFPIRGCARIIELPKYAIELLYICEKKFGWEALLANLKKHRWEFHFGCYLCRELYDVKLRDRLLQLIQVSKDYKDMLNKTYDLLHQVAKEKKHHFRWY